MSCTTGAKHSAAAVARRPKRAPYDRRWWTRTAPRAQWLREFAEDVGRMAPALTLSGRIRDLFIVKTSPLTSDGATRQLCHEYRRDRGKPVTAKTVEHRVRALLRKRQAAAVGALVAEGQARGDYDPPVTDEERRSIGEPTTSPTHAARKPLPTPNWHREPKDAGYSSDDETGPDSV